MSARRDLTPILSLFFAERRAVMLGGIAAASASMLAGMALLGLSGWFITATALAGGTLATALAFDVFAPAAAIRFLAIARTGTRYGERLVTHDAALGMLAGLREKLFRGWAAPDQAHRLLVRPSRLLFRLTEDIDALGALYLRVLVPAGAALATAIAAGVALGFLHPLLGVAVAATVIAAGLGIPLLSARQGLRPAWRRAMATEALRARCIDLVSGQTDLVMAGRMHAQRQSIADADRRLARADEALNRIETRSSTLFAIAGSLLLACTLLAVAALAERGAISAPLAAMAMLVAFVAVEPFAALRRGAAEFGRMLIAARRISPRLAPPHHAPEIKAPAAGFAVQIAGVTARHPGALHPVLENLSLDIAVGERLALVGPSGSGKSTLMALIAGELSSVRGSVAPIASTLLTQRTELFQDSVRDNLRLADPRAEDQRLWNALREAGLAGTVEVLPHGLYAPLGDGGSGLSGGQSRRLTLARLFLRDAPMWLLDEPTEGLDGATATDILDRLGGLASGHTLVIATHLRREAELADRLVVMQHGRIVSTARRGEAKFDTTLARLRPDR